MKIHLLVLMGVPVALSACVAHTMQGLREHTPTLTASSAKPTDVIGPCLMAATDKLGIATYVPGAHGASFSVQLGGQITKVTLIAGEINDVGDHRQVTLWPMKQLVPTRMDHAVERMRACL